jgi:predicted PurR-regulated permease PerM
MMNETPESASFDRRFVNNMVESALRIGLIVILLFWTYDIIRPFVIPVIWGDIIAIAAGIIGLFVGAVVLAVWYKLFQAWINQIAHESDTRDQPDL